MKNSIYLTVILSLVTSYSYAKEINGPVKATASIQSICSISADSINFGVIFSPLVSQASTGEMTIFCNNRTSYNVSLAYGGIYGVQGASPGYWRLTNRDNYEQYHYWEYTRYSGSGAYRYKQTVNYYGYGGPSQGYIETELGCVTSGGSCVLQGVTYDYGLMKGIINSDSVAYSFFVPNQPSTVWNTGKGSYSSIGSGDKQTIPLLVKIVPNNSSSKFPAPDMYSDIITATISY